MEFENIFEGLPKEETLDLNSASSKRTFKLDLGDEKLNQYVRDHRAASLLSQIQTSEESFREVLSP